MAPGLQQYRRSAWVGHSRHSKCWASEVRCHVVWATAAHKSPRVLDITCWKKQVLVMSLTEGAFGELATTFSPGDAMAWALHWPLKSMLDGSSSLLHGSWMSPFLMTKDQCTVTGERPGSTRWVWKTKSLAAEQAERFFDTLYNTAFRSTTLFRKKI